MKISKTMSIRTLLKLLALELILFGLIATYQGIMTSPPGMWEIPKEFLK